MTVLQIYPVTYFVVIISELFKPNGVTVYMAAPLQQIV